MIDGSFTQTAWLTKSVYNVCVHWRYFKCWHDSLMPPLGRVRWQVDRKWNDEIIFRNVHAVSCTPSNYKNDSSYHSMKLESIPYIMKRKGERDRKASACDFPQMRNYPQHRDDHWTTDCRQLPVCARLVISSTQMHVLSVWNVECDSYWTLWRVDCSHRL